MIDPNRVQNVNKELVKIEKSLKELTKLTGIDFGDNWRWIMSKIPVLLVHIPADIQRATEKYGEWAKERLKELGETNIELEYVEVEFYHPHILNVYYRKLDDQEQRPFGMNWHRKMTLNEEEVNANSI